MAGAVNHDNSRADLGVNDCAAVAGFRGSRLQIDPAFVNNEGEDAWQENGADNSAGVHCAFPLPANF
jgi:hypothetical protein